MCFSSLKTVRRSHCSFTVCLTLTVPFFDGSRQPFTEKKKPENQLVDYLLNTKQQTDTVREQLVNIVENLGTIENHNLQLTTC